MRIMREGDEAQACHHPQEASGVHRKNAKQRPQRRINHNVRSIASLRGLVSQMTDSYRKGKGSYDERPRSKAP